MKWGKMGRREIRVQFEVFLETPTVDPRVGVLGETLDTKIMVSSLVAKRLNFKLWEQSSKFSFSRPPLENPPPPPRPPPLPFWLKISR